MRITKLNLALLILPFITLNAAELRGQTKSCNLTLHNMDFQANEIKKATATAVNIKDKRVYRSITKDEMPAFLNLPESEYEITVSKPGFKRTREPYEVVCKDATEGVLSFTMWMEKGSAKEIFRNPKFKIGSAIANPPVISSSDASQGVRVSEETSTDFLPESKKDVKVIRKGIINGTAISLPKPEYPPAAKAVRADGTVSVQVTVDEEGNVISASAVSGHPLLHTAAVGAARMAKFKPTILSGQSVKVTGIITYYFVVK